MPALDWNIAFQRATNLLTTIAVPFFFYMSGWLFFNHISEMNDIRQKLKRRIRTLIIPFFLWNLLLLIIFAILFQVSCIREYVYYFCKMEYSWMYFFSKLTFSPIIGQFWFIRDLILFVALAPVWYYVVRHAALYLAVLSVLLLYWSPVDTGLFSSEGVLFFFLGALCGFRGIDLFSISRYWGISACVIAITGWVLMQEVDWAFSRLYICAGICAFTWGISVFYSSGIRYGKLLSLASYSFFIYAFHAPLIGIMKNVVLRIGGRHIGISIAAYILVPTAVFFIALGAARLIRKVFPQFYGILTGQRG